MSCDDGRVSLVQVHREADLGKESDPGAATSTPASASSASTPALTREPDLQRESASYVVSLPTIKMKIKSIYLAQMPCFLKRVAMAEVSPPSPGLALSQYTQSLA